MHCILRFARITILFLMTSTALIAQNSPTPSSELIVSSYETTLPATPTTAQSKLIVETYITETHSQYYQAEAVVTAQAQQALKENGKLGIDLVFAEYTTSSLPGVQALNQRAATDIQQARQELGVSESLVRPANLAPDTAKLGFSTLFLDPRVAATELSLPPLSQTEITETSSQNQTALPSQATNYTGRILTVVRTITATGINTFMIYSVLKSDMFSPMVIPALLFYPVMEYGFQAYASAYENVLKKFKNLYSRAVFRTAVSFACLAAHVGVLSMASVQEFSLYEITALSFKGAILSHSWWEMAVKQRPKFLSGTSVSFGLGMVGMVGMMLATQKIPAGSYIIYALGASGAIIWSFNGALSDLQKDAIIVRDHFYEKFKAAGGGLQNSCHSLGQQIHSRFFRSRP